MNFTISHSPTTRALYAEGAGIARAIPEAVVVPRSADEVVEVVRWAAESGKRLVPRGSGSGMAGGAVGRDVIVDLSRLDALGAVDDARRRVWVGPGAVRDAVDAAAREQGLRFPVDPSSGAFCTVGGMAGTNAAGAHSLRVGSMRSWVTALDCVFADGSRATVGRGDAPPSCAPVERFLAQVAPRLRAEAESAAHAETAAAMGAARTGTGSAPSGMRAHAGVRKDSSGYALDAFARSGELVDLLVGSEGTLALFVGVELALEPVPGATASLLAEFPSLEGAVAGAAAARVEGASACELLDRTFLDVAGDAAATLAAGTEAVLLIEVEGANEGAASAAAARLDRACRGAGASAVQRATDRASETRLWAIRHAASPTLARLDPSLRSMQFIEDGAVPPTQLSAYVRGVRAALAAQGIRGVIFGHAGDAHVHVNPLIDVSRPDWRVRVGALLEEVTALAASLGGTLTGEHGDGRLRTPLLARTWPEDALALFGAVKNAFDPEGILNPGVKVPLPGQRPVEDVKYDPTLPPLPPLARAALDAIERDRAWNRWRFDYLPAAG